MYEILYVHSATYKQSLTYQFFKFSSIFGGETEFLELILHPIFYSTASTDNCLHGQLYQLATCSFSAQCLLMVYFFCYTQDEGVCGESKGCFSIPPGCDTADPANSCTAFSSWSLGEDGLILFNLVAGADGYIAIGLSKSGGMVSIIQFLIHIVHSHFSS